jgi:hypothetical protein
VAGACTSFGCQTKPSGNDDASEIDFDAKAACFIAIALASLEMTSVYSYTDVKITANEFDSKTGYPPLGASE